MPAQSALSLLPRPRASLDLRYVRRPAWRVWSTLLRVHRRPEEAHHLGGLAADIRRLTLHPRVPLVVTEALQEHLLEVVRAPHLTDAVHDDILIHTLRPGSPGWQLTGVVAVLLAAGHPERAQELITALPRATTQAGARQRWAARRVLRTGEWGQGDQSRVVLHPALLHLVQPTVAHVRALARRSPGHPGSASVDWPALWARVPVRNRWRAQVWAGLASAGPHLRDADRAVASMPHQTARDHLLGLLAQAASAAGRPTLTEDLVRQVRGRVRRTDTIARICDQLYVSGDTDRLEHWLPVLSLGPRPEHRAVAATLQLLRTVETAGSDTTVHASRVMREACRMLPTQRDAWALWPRPRPTERRTLLVVAGGGPAPSLRRQVSSGVVRRTILSRLGPHPVRAAQRIACLSDGDTSISDALVAAWWASAPAARDTSAAPLDTVSHATLQGTLRRGFGVAWRRLQAVRSERFDPEAWLTDFRHTHQRWPTPWELAKHPRAKSRPRSRTARLPPDHSPVSVALGALGWSPDQRSRLERGGAWFRLASLPRFQGVSETEVAEWTEGRWPSRVPPDLSPQEWRVVRSAWSDPLCMVLKVRPRPLWSTATSMWVVTMSLLAGTHTVAAHVLPPVGTVQDETIAPTVDFIRRTCLHLGFVGLALPDALAPESAALRPGIRVRPLSTLPALPEPRGGTTTRWIDLQRPEPNMH